LRVGKELLPSRVKNFLFYPCPLLRVTFLWQEAAILMLRFHDIETLAVRGVDNS